MTREGDAARRRRGRSRTTIVDVGGAKVGIIGLSTPDTPNVDDAGERGHARLRRSGRRRRSTRRSELRAHGADAVIVIAHMGGRCKDIDDDPNDSSSCETEQEAMRFLDALPKGTIDAYFAGHTHSQMRQVHQRRAGAAGARLQPRVLDRRPDRRSAPRITSTQDGDAPADDDLRAGLRAARRRAIAKCAGRRDARSARLRREDDRRPTRRSPRSSSRTSSRSPRSATRPLGIRTTDALQARILPASRRSAICSPTRCATLHEADIAFLNSGGIRADLPRGRSRVRRHVRGRRPSTTSRRS